MAAQPQENNPGKIKMLPPENDRSAAAWLSLLAGGRGSTSRPRLYVSGEPLAAAAYAFFRTHKYRLTPFGIEGLYLRTFGRHTRKLYSLTNWSEPLPTQPPSLPPRSNLEIIRSRSISVYDSVSDPESRLQAEIVAYVVPGSRAHRRDVKAFCNYLLGDFVLYEKDAYFRGLELGSADLDRLSSRYEAGHSRPGTYGRHVVKQLSRSTGAKACFLCLHDEQHIFLEYAHINVGRRRHRTIILGGTHVLLTNDLTSDLLASLRDSSYAYLGPDDPMAKRFCAAASQRLGGVNFTGDDLWLTPIVYDRQPLASFTFIFEVGAYGFSSPALALAQKAAQGFRSAARYLYQRRTKRLIVDPIFRSRETRIKADVGFLIMPFNEPWSATVASAVRGVLGGLGIDVIRADDMQGENVIEDIWSAIVTSQYVVADVTGRNPNVYYEVGVAHTVGKRVLLLSQSADDIPFNIRYLRHVIYSNDLAGYESIRNGILKFVA